MSVPPEAYLHPTHHHHPHHVPGGVCAPTRRAVSLDAAGEGVPGIKSLASHGAAHVYSASDFDSGVGGGGAVAAANWTAAVHAAAAAVISPAGRLTGPLSSQFDTYPSVEPTGYGHWTGDMLPPRPQVPCRQSGASGTMADDAKAQRDTGDATAGSESVSGLAEDNNHPAARSSSGSLPASSSDPCSGEASRSHLPMSPEAGAATVVGTIGSNLMVSLRPGNAGASGDALGNASMQ
jgi:hypothetical protein